MMIVRGFCFTTAFAATILIAGCTTVEQAQRTIRDAFRPPSVVAGEPGIKRASQITLEELEQLTYGFADRYFTATDSIERDKEKRRAFAYLRLFARRNLSDAAVLMRMRLKSKAASAWPAVSLTR